MQNMNSSQKLSYAIAAILSGTPVAVSFAARRRDGHRDGDSEALAEITVTAQRRSETLENVPITIQAITGRELRQLNVQTHSTI